MINNQKIILTFLLFTYTLTSGKEYIEFEVKRYLYAFLFTLILGIVGLIAMALKGKDKK